MVGRTLLYAGAAIGFVGLVVASAAAHVSGVLLIVAGLLMAGAARAGVATAYAPPQMPARNVRLVAIGLAIMGCFFVAIGIGELVG